MPVALVVDDDPDLRDVVVYMLEQVGFEVHLESDGEAGLKLAMAVKPDVVLLDWMMPRLSGVEVCRSLRSNPDFDSIAVILLTAKAQGTDVQLGFDAGADDYIVKPFRPRELINRVQVVLARPRDQLNNDHESERALMRDGRQVETGAINQGGSPA